MKTLLLKEHIGYEAGQSMHAAMKVFFY